MNRAEFSRKVRLEIILRAGGRCELCSAKLKVGEGEVDHILPCALGGEPTVENGRFICRVCHTGKTQDDIRMIRKSDRQRDKHLGAKVKKPWNNGLRKRMNGTVVDAKGNVVSPK